MYFNNNSFLRDWITSVIAWVSIIYFYGLITVFGFKTYFQKNPITEYIYSSVFHLEIILTGIILGTLFIAINRATELAGLRKRSFGLNILIRSILYFLSLLICTFLIYQMFSRLEIVTSKQFQYYQQYLLDFRYMLSVTAYIFFFIFLMNFVIQINKKFGPGVLFDLLRGKYYHPRNEHMVLLFIDLKSSTTISESLGHERYSQFIKECVHELTPVLIKNKASVYQYVGDEIVLHWKMKDGFEHLRCLDTFFEFKQRLDQRKYHFQDNYGVNPEFKAGMDAGEVTITEIGDLKREIAFHGDVLNTAARLEKKCNEYHRLLLVTENLVDRLPSSNGYKFEFLNDIPLRGKHEKVKFFAVEPVVKLPSK